MTLMKKLLLFALPFTLFYCNSPSEKNGNSELNTGFESFRDAFVEKLWVVYPGWATEAGYHKYDSLFPAPTEANRNMELAFASSCLDSLKNFPTADLNDLNRMDYSLMENFLNKISWGINKWKGWRWDPSSYNACGSFSYLLGEPFAPLDARLKILAVKLKNVPAYYEAAIQNISTPTAEHTQLAMDQNLGGMGVFDSDIPDSVKVSGLDNTTKSNILSLCKAASAAVHRYVDFLKTTGKGKHRSFRAGEELYREKFAFDIQSRYSPDEIFNAAMERKKELHSKMSKLAIELWPKYFGTVKMPHDSLTLIRKMIDTLSVKHVKPEDFQSSIEKQIPELVKFISDKNLIYLDPSKPLKVRKEPAYMAGVAGASISAPGPYDKSGNTYYNVGSLSGWDKARAESYLREYNYYILQILNIHEAIPGHYTQLVYSNQSPSLVKSILGNGAMVEGWAVYGERMMLENGYGNNEPEMWLMYYKWNLRSTCNTILDISVHTKNMTHDEALDLLTRQAFQQQAEAEGKWRRVNVTSVQLCSYFDGFKEISDLRDEYMKKRGDTFNLKSFHEKFLSYGSAPVKEIRERMMAEEN